MPLAYDYGAVARWSLEDGLDAVTIEPSGRVVFTTFDTNPAVFTTVAFREATFDEVADGVAPPSLATLWNRAAAQLRALRRAGATPCITIRAGDLGGTRVLVMPYLWTLDAARISSPHTSGPEHAGCADERPALVPGGPPFVVAVAPGAHRLEGDVRFFEASGPRDVAFAVDVEVEPGRDVALELVREGDAVIARSVRSSGA